MSRHLHPGSARRGVRATVAVSLCGLLGACTGEIGTLAGREASGGLPPDGVGNGGTPAAGSSGNPGAGSGGGGSASGSGGVPGVDGPCLPALPARLSLLGDYQHLNSLRSLLGPSAVSAADSAENTAQTKPFMTKGMVVNTSLVHQRNAWAEAASAALNDKFAEITSCQPSTVDDACARRFLEKFAPRAFRRPVDAEEITDAMVVYDAAKTVGFTNGVRRAVEALLTAPSFMYKRELGQAGPDGTIALSPHEVATEISYLLTDQPPDTELTSAADSGTLANAGEIERQVTRLLARTDVKESLRSTLMAAWGLANLFGTEKDPKLFPEYGPQLQASMFRETELFVQDVLWDRKAPVRTLLDARTSFVNQPVAALYGIPYSGTGDAFVPVTLPAQRAGLLTQPSVLSTLARTDNTSVVARGLFVRGLLCFPKLGGPPAALATRIQDLLKADMTERERAEVRKQDAVCSQCHRGIDPFGLLLESYDALGKYRTTLGGKTIDASATVELDGALDGQFADALAFIDAAADTPEFVTCVGTRLLGYATQDDGVLASSCQVKEMLSKVDPATVTMSDLVLAVTSSPALRLRAKEAP